MRVFCPEHKRGFLTPRQSPIKCENKGHLLGELDFQGEAKLPLELQWQYCCNCEHFCPIDLNKDGLKRCPVCTRRSSKLYLCDRCYTTSFESDTPLQTKNFTLTSEGAPQPSCPGCLHDAPADLHEHTCDGLGLSLITALNSCPICLERLDVGPSFPATVSDYLRRTKAANKINVTFDYETELFVPVEDGEFVLISTGSEVIQTIVLPRMTRLSSKLDFYEFYQDYYHCVKPDAGEVHIIRPAAVVPVVPGWKLLATGILEVLADQSKKKARVGPIRNEADMLVHEEPRLAAMKVESPVTSCTNCGLLVESRYAFCWKCGHPLTRTSASSVDHSEPEAIMPSAVLATDEDELTVQHDLRNDGPPILSWVMAKEPGPAGSAKGSVLKLIAIVVVGLMLVSLGLVVLTRSASRMAAVTADEPVSTPAAANSESGSGSPPARTVESEAAIARTPQRVSTARPEDDELKTLRERRKSATASARSAILQAFATAEKRYPNDYRFPYERAKLALKVPRSHSHDEAFSALARAAAKAINTGKAHEMLDGLEADKAGDFHKLSLEHHEWNQLTEALKNKDMRLVSAMATF